jgi:Glycosyl hydrolases family 43
MKGQQLLNSSTQGILAAAALLAGSLLAANISIAQTPTQTAGGGTNTAGAALTNAATGEQPAGTNAPGGRRRGGGRGNRGPAPTFPPGEAERLVKLGNRGVGVHDPSTIAKCKDEYWIFFTGNGVPSWRSKDLITWTRGPQAITNAVPWTTNVSGFRGRNFWAPDVLKFGDRFLLYYSASAFGRNTSGIGLATNPTLDPEDPNYKWTDQGMVVGSGTNVDYNTIDPAITADANGGLWLAFGSFWSGIKLIQLDPKTGLRIARSLQFHRGLLHLSSR